MVLFGQLYLLECAAVGPLSTQEAPATQQSRPGLLAKGKVCSPPPKKNHTHTPTPHALTYTLTLW